MYFVGFYVIFGKYKFVIQKCYLTRLIGGLLPYVDYFNYVSFILPVSKGSMPPAARDNIVQNKRRNDNTLGFSVASRLVVKVTRFESQSVSDHFFLTKAFV